MSLFEKFVNTTGKNTDSSNDRKNLFEKFLNTTGKNTDSSNTKKDTNSSNDTYSPSLVDRIIGGFSVGGQAYGNVFSGKPLMTGIDEKISDIEKGIVRDEEGEVVYEGGKKVDKDENDKKDPNLDPIYGGMKPKEFYGMLEQMGERGANRKFLRSGIQALANSPLIAGQAALEAAKNVGNLTALNMAAMADQNLVLSQNPTKQKIAGKYFG